MSDITYLSKRTISKYCGRKKEGVLSVLIDVKEDKIYPVPKGIEHIDFAALLLGFKPREFGKALIKNPLLAVHLITSTINIEDVKGQKIITGIVTGMSGMETGYNVKHYKADLRKAYAMTWECINESVQLKTVVMGKLKIDKIMFKFSF